MGMQARPCEPGIDLPLAHGSRPIHQEEKSLVVRTAVPSRDDAKLLKKIQQLRTFHTMAYSERYCVDIRHSSDSFRCP